MKTQKQTIKQQIKELINLNHSKKEIILILKDKQIKENTIKWYFNKLKKTI